MTDQQTTPRPLRKIACIGEVMIEMVLQDDGGAALNVAGDTYNTAVYLAQRLQGTPAAVSYVTALGQDSFSLRAMTRMQAEGIDTACVERRADKSIGLYAIETDGAGERSFTYWRSDSAARTMFQAPCTVDLRVLADFDLIYLSGITLAILPPLMRTALLAALDACRRGGALVAYDSNHRPRLWESAAVARETNIAMWQRTDIALPSVDDESVIHDDDSEAAALARLAGYGLTRGALKRGPTGPAPLVGRYDGPPFPAVTQVVDTTAAGDSFNAGYLAAIVQGQSADRAMMAGHMLAAHVVQRRGAIVPLDGA